MPVVVTQYAAQSLAARHVASCAARFFPRLYRSVAQPLVVSLGVKMDHDPGYGDLQRTLSEEGHALQALLPDRGMKRSRFGFKFGERAGKRAASIPARSKMIRNVWENFVSRSIRTYFFPQRNP